MTPIELWLLIFAAAFIVLITFVVFGVLVGGYPRLVHEIRRQRAIRRYDREPIDHLYVGRVRLDQERLSRRQGH